MISLSYSTINMLYQASHNWINKMCGLKPEERPEWAVGKKIHQIIQDHISGKKLHRSLKHIKYTFPVVEEVDFDSRCKFDFPLLNTNYNIIGFYDGLDLDNKRFLEIKSSDPLWSIRKFQDSLQRKVYALAKPELSEAILITCSKDTKRWQKTPPVVYKVPLTQKDREEALKWILGGVKILESGEFSGGLDKEGKCTDPWCYYGANCQFK